MSSRHDTLPLACDADQHHELNLAVDKARKGSTHIKVDKSALDALLRDHGTMQRKLREIGITPLSPGEVV